LTKIDNVKKLGGEKRLDPPNTSRVIIRSLKKEEVNHGK